MAIVGWSGVGVAMAAAGLVIGCGTASAGTVQRELVQLPSRCTNSQLSVTSRPIGAAMSHAGVQAVFTNHSARACQLFGYPGAAAVDRHGRQFEQARRTRNGYLAGRDTGRPRTIVIRPGAKASSVIEGTSVGGRNCQRGRALLVTPPNTRKSTRVPFRGYFCNLEVHRVISGVQH